MEETTRITRSAARSQKYEGLGVSTKLEEDTEMTVASLDQLESGATSSVDPIVKVEAVDMDLDDELHTSEYESGNNQ